MGSVSVNINGSWKEINNVKCNANNTWQQIKQIYVNVNGVWREIWSYIYTDTYELPPYIGRTINSRTYTNAVVGSIATLTYHSVHTTEHGSFRGSSLLYITGASVASFSDNATGFQVHSYPWTHYVTCYNYSYGDDGSIYCTHPSYGWHKYANVAEAKAADAMVGMGSFNMTVTIKIKIKSPTFVIKINGDSLTSNTGTISYQREHT